MLKFEWDRDKAELNQRKHGVTFEEASTAFGDPLSSTIVDPEHSVGEKRYLLLGLTHAGRLLVVSHLEVARDTIRIISARTATRAERRDYEEEA